MKMAEGEVWVLTATCDTLAHAHFSVSDRAHTERAHERFSVDGGHFTQLVTVHVTAQVI